MTEKIADFFKQHWPRAATAPAAVAAAVLAVALAAAFLSLVARRKWRPNIW